MWYALYCKSTKLIAYQNFSLIILLLLNCPHRHTHKNVFCGLIAPVVTVILGLLFEGMGGVQCPSICLLYRQGIKWKGAWSSILWKAPGGEWKLPSQPIEMGDRQKKLGQGKAIQNWNIGLHRILQLNWQREDWAGQSPERRNILPQYLLIVKVGSNFVIVDELLAW